MARNLSKTPKYVAVHEAGHAVAHIAVMPDSRAFQRVFIRTPEECLAGPYIDDRGRESHCIGMVEEPSLCQSKLYRLLGNAGGTIELLLGDANQEHLPVFRANMEAQCVQILAGPYAEARFRRRSRLAALLDGGDDDFADVRACVNFFTQTDRQRQELWRELEARTSKLLSEHWDGIIAVAGALLAKRSLAYDEVRHILFGPDR